MAPEELEKKPFVTRYEYSKDFIGPKIAFPSQFCEKIFELRRRLKKHLQTKHPTKQEEVKGTV